MEKLMTFEEACGVLRLKPGTMYKLVARREIAHVKTSPGRGGRLLFREEDLHLWIVKRLIRTGTTAVRRGRPQIRLVKKAAGS